MSLLAGLGKGLQGAGQAISQGLYAYAMAMQEDDREKMRQASIEKRWAKEDERMAKQDARQAEMDKKEETRYAQRSAKEDARYQESLKFREQDASRADARESRQDEKQSAIMLGQSLDRLDAIKNDKAKAIEEMFVDPLTKQVTDPDAYRAAMADLNKSYLEDASKMVQRSGMSESQINKYGFSMYVPEDSEAISSKNDLIRNDGTKKGSGYFGVLKNSKGQDVTEYSIGVNIDGKEVEIPTLVPTLTKEEINEVLKASSGEGELPVTVKSKAIEFAKQRISAGESPFKVSGDLSQSAPSFDKSQWANSIRQPSPAPMPAAEFSAQLTPAQMAALTPEQQRERIAQLQTLRQSGQQAPQPQAGLLNRVKAIW